MLDNERLAERATTIIVCSLPPSDIENAKTGRWTHKAMELQRRIVAELAKMYQQGIEESQKQPQGRK